MLAKRSHFHSGTNLIFLPLTFSSAGFSHLYYGFSFVLESCIYAAASKNILCMKELFSAGKFLKVLQKDLKMNGKMHRFYIIDVKDGVIIIPITDRGEIILERHFRPALDDYLYELPAGYIDDGEKPRGAAIRELEEETGYLAKKVRLLFTVYTSSGRSKQKAYFFVATKFVGGNMRYDGGELISKIIKVNLKKAIEMVNRGKITDLGTMAAILYLQTHKISM